MFALISLIFGAPVLLSCGTEYTGKLSYDPDHPFQCIESRLKPLDAPSIATDSNFGTSLKRVIETADRINAVHHNSITGLKDEIAALKLKLENCMKSDGDCITIMEELHSMMRDIKSAIGSRNLLLVTYKGETYKWSEVGTYLTKGLNSIHKILATEYASEYILNDCITTMKPNGLTSLITAISYTDHEKDSLTDIAVEVALESSSNVELLNGVVARVSENKTIEKIKELIEILEQILITCTMVDDYFNLNSSYCKAGLEALEKLKKLIPDSDFKQLNEYIDGFKETRGNNNKLISSY
eukprot:NODE_24_length_36516_cov_0.652470.p10 type:complete len:298 gc:universal NODE_24_length_36516_cov_0.652470:18481-19374(+)